MSKGSDFAISGDQQFWLLITNLSAIFLLKIALVIVSYLIIRMGYQLLVDGVKGEFKFKSEMHGVKADLVSASPGTLFLLLGVAALIYALTATHKIPFKQEVEQKQTQGKENKNGIPKKDPFK